MAQHAARGRETFIARSLRDYRENVASNFRQVNQWRGEATRGVKAKLSSFAEWEGENKAGIIAVLAILCWLTLTGWFVVDWSMGKVAGNAAQTGVGGIVGGAIVSLIISPLVAIAAFVLILALNLVVELFAAVVLFVPLLLWAPVFGLLQTLAVGFKLLLVVPLGLLFVATRLVQLWRGIFHTCPSRACSYRGLPIYVCPKCGTGDARLWPNLYGLLWHYCVKCDERMPTLDILGRKKLARRCGGDACGHMPLLGKHAGRAPERLVAITGAQTSGKTNFLLMAVNSIVNGGHKGRVPIRGAIDIEVQERVFEETWKRMSAGIPPSKTAAAPHAFLLYSKVGSAKSQLYLYDAPGEEFEAVSLMTRQQYFPLLEGFVLLVDPLSFEAVRVRSGAPQGAYAPLEKVVNSMVAAAVSGVPRGKKLPMKVAVTISKADLPAVREALGDIRQGPVKPELCRRAIAAWGGENSLRLLEHYFEGVEYFACSPLGRDVGDGRSKEPFQSHGVMEPLTWILTGQRN